jgi:hypothetical protein
MKIFWEKWGLGLIVLGVIIAVLQFTHPGLAVTVP